MYSLYNEHNPQKCIETPFFSIFTPSLLSISYTEVLVFFLFFHKIVLTPKLEARKSDFDCLETSLQDHSQYQITFMLCTYVYASKF